MITREEADRLRDRLLAVLAEDAHNARRLVARLDSLTHESGVAAHSALLLILTHLAFEEEQARRHWEAILAHREQLSRSLQRDCGVRVAVLDYFTNVNRQLVEPTLIDLEMLDTTRAPNDVDSLTGLASDRRFRSALQAELRRARRYEQKTAVVLMDLDGFGRVNERLGSLIGDRLLRELAILLHNKVRDIDLAGRPGEDEIVVLLPETDRNGALLVAERFRREVQAYFARRESAGVAVDLTLSAGVACYPEDASSAEELLQRAAQALYEAKASGKNAVRVYLPERRRYLRFELEAGRFEVEVLAPADRHALRLANLSRSGILFTSPEPLEVGEPIELRLADTAGRPARSLRIRGSVVRLEQLPPPHAPSPAQTAEGAPDEDTYEIGVAFDLDWTQGTEDLLEFLEQAQQGRIGREP